MKKITLLLLFILNIGIAISQNCDLTETTSYTGAYQMEQITPSIFDFETFTDGDGMLFTLFSEQTDSSQEDPGIPLDINQRSFDATYLLEAGIGQPAETFIIGFNDCGVTFTSVEETGLACNGAALFLGPLVGGDFDSDDDSAFTLIFEDSLGLDCVGEGSPTVEIRFFKGATLICQDINVVTDSGACEAIVNFDTPIASDLDGTTIVAEQTGGPVSGSTFPLGVTTIQFSVTSNVTGQVTNCNFDITVTENIPPTIECPTDIVLGTGGAPTAIIPDFTDLAIVSDNCTASEELVVTQEPVAGTEVNSGDTIPISLIVTDVSGNQEFCSFDVLFDPTLSLENTLLDSTFSIYPNPTQGAFTINNASLDSLSEVAIYDINGRLIETIRTGLGVSETQISIQEYASGIYFARISTATGSVVRRIVKQ